MVRTHLQWTTRNHHLGKSERAWSLAGWASLAVCLAPAGRERPGRSPLLAAAPALSLDRLDRDRAGRSWKASTGKPTPAPYYGYLPGKAIYCPCDKNAALRSRLTDALWHGKVFDCDGGSLVNQWCAHQAIRACVCYEAESARRQELHYHGLHPDLPHLQADVRDEAREVAPASTWAGCTASRTAGRSSRCSSRCKPVAGKQVRSAAALPCRRRRPI